MCKVKRKGGVWTEEALRSPLKRPTAELQHFSAVFWTSDSKFDDAEEAASRVGGLF